MLRLENQGASSYNIITNSCASNCKTVLGEVGINAPFYTVTPKMLQSYFKRIGGN